MNKIYISALILISGILISGAIIGLARAETTALDTIQYPIQELGNCTNKSSCKLFCDATAHSEACLRFAEKHSMMSQKELTNAKQFQNNGMVGPGGCEGQNACEQYCGDSTHLDECIVFAKKNGMMSDKQLQESEKVLAAIKKGIKPPACSGPKQCNTYCSNPAHMEECMAFSIAAGVIPEGQKEQMQKTLEAIRQGAKPPSCQPTPPPDQIDQPVQSESGLESCDTYCSTHTEECMSFALATGTVPDNEKEQMQKSLDAIKRGIKPPSCRPKPQMTPHNKPDQFGKDLQDCDQYCADSNHVEECVNFSVAMGNMTEKQAQSAIKNGNKGPGGCIGKEACNAFCDNPDNQDTCFNFGKDNGMIPEADIQKMQEGQQKMKDSFSQIPQAVIDCISSSAGADVVEKMKSGSMIARKMGDSINKCFQANGIQERKPGQEQQGQSNPQGQPWADMCKPDGNGKPTSLACTDGDGKFVVSAKMGEDGKPVCPGGSTATCGDYEQNNRSRPNDNRPGINQSEPRQPNQPGTMLPQQQQQQFRPEQGDQPGSMQPRQPGQFNPLNQPNPLNLINQPSQQEQQQQPQFQPQPPAPMQPQEQLQQPPPPLPPTSSMQFKLQNPIHTQAQIQILTNMVANVFSFLSPHIGQ